MTMRTPYLPLAPEFGPFLFSSIGEEENGMSLTLLSALARLGVDPWEEAARLAALPKSTALGSLVALLGRLPAGQSGVADRTPIARRLVALLPAPEATPEGAAHRRADLRRRPRAMWLLWALLAGLLFVAGHYISVHSDLATPVETSSHE
jgi:hypothetical protein